MKLKYLIGTGVEFHNAIIYDNYDNLLGVYEEYETGTLYDEAIVS